MVDPSGDHDASCSQNGSGTAQFWLNSGEYQASTVAVLPRSSMKICRRPCPPTDVKVPITSSLLPSGLSVVLYTDVRLVPLCRPPWSVEAELPEMLRLM